MITYQTKKETLYCAEIGSYAAFGIEVSEIINGQERLIDFIPDVFLDGTIAERFIKMCNQFHLDRIHLHDVIEDWSA